MISSQKREPLRERWGTGTIFWVIIIALLTILMLWLFEKETRDEEKYQKHKDVEHNNTFQYPKQNNHSRFYSCFDRLGNLEC